MALYEQKIVEKVHHVARKRARIARFGHRWTKRAILAPQTKLGRAKVQCDFFRMDNPPSPSVRRRFACRRPVSAGFAQKRSRISPVIYLCPLYDRPVACRGFAVRRHHRPAHSGKAMVSRGCRTWQTILSFPTVSPVSRSASRRAVPARRTPSASAKPSARLMPVSLRLRRRECARPPLSEKIIIKPLKKVEDHLWKLENPE